MTANGEVLPAQSSSLIRCKGGRAHCILKVRLARYVPSSQFGLQVSSVFLLLKRRPPERQGFAGRHLVVPQGGDALNIAAAPN